MALGITNNHSSMESVVQSIKKAIWLFRSCTNFKELMVPESLTTNEEQVKIKLKPVWDIISEACDTFSYREALRYLRAYC